MICPHCDGELLRTQRTGRRCALCEKRFALEPKENPLKLHDVRMRRLAQKLGHGGTRYTVPQLWYAASRNRLTDPVDSYVGGCLAVVFVPLVGLLFAAITSELDGEVMVPALLIAGVVIVVGVPLLLAGAVRARRRGRIRTPLQLEDFRELAVKEWHMAYGDLPAGLVDDSAARLPAVAAPRMALVCQDRAVLVCLAANRLAERHGMALVESAAQAPPDVPVLVLHDASPSGVAFAARVHAALGARAEPVGMLPRAVMAREKALRLREKPLPPDEADALRPLPAGLTEEECAWLAGGWWSPLAAVAPAKLVAVVSDAAERVAGRGDPDRRAARRLGFLTWPVA